MLKRVRMVKKILFTGARSGILHQVIEELLQKDYLIYITVHRESQLKWVKQYYQQYDHVFCFQLDITNFKDREYLKTLDIDILVHHVGIGCSGSIADIPISLMRENFEVNVFSFFEVVQIVLEGMIVKGRGRIILTSSLLAFMPLPFLGVYCATKASILKMGTALSKELKRISSITVSIIEPGAYYTGFNQVMIEQPFSWKNRDSYFEGERQQIWKEQHLLFSLIEKKQLRSVVRKMVKCIETRHPRLIYRVPISQVIPCKLYELFFQ